MIRFILDSTLDGYARHYGAMENVQIGILHRAEDDYKLAGDGQTIKEQMPIRTFIMRVMDRKPYSDMDIDRRIDEIKIAINTTNPGFSDKRATNLAEMYDQRYATMIRNGEVVLAEHKFGVNYDPRIDRCDTISNNERSVTQSMPEWDHKKATDYMKTTGMYPTDAMRERLGPLTTVDGGKVIDNEIYYLLTMPS